MEKKNHESYMWIWHANQVNKPWKILSVWLIQKKRKEERKSQWLKASRFASIKWIISIIDLKGEKNIISLVCKGKNIHKENDVILRPQATNKVISDQFRTKERELFFCLWLQVCYYFLLPLCKIIWDNVQPTIGVFL